MPAADSATAGGPSAWDRTDGSRPQDAFSRSSRPCGWGRVGNAGLPRPQISPLGPQAFETADGLMIIDNLISAQPVWFSFFLSFPAALRGGNSQGLCTDGLAERPRCGTGRVSPGVVAGEVLAGSESRRQRRCRWGGGRGREGFIPTLGLHSAITTVEAIKGLLITGLCPCTQSRHEGLKVTKRRVKKKS